MAEVVLFDPDFSGWENNIDSQNFRFNVGLLSIGSFIKSKGIDTRIYYRPNYYLKDLNKIINSDVKLVGISVMTIQISHAIALAKKIKKISPDLPIVVGGCHVRLFPKDMLKQKEFDIVVPGGGEIPMQNIFKTISSGRSLREVNGVGFKQGGKFIWTTPLEDIDVKLLPKMDYSIVDNFSLVKWYDGQKSMYVYSGAGCPFRCTFCINSISFRKFQQRKISDVVNEIEMLIKTYGITHVYPTDEFFCANKARLLEFLDLIEKKKLKFTWFVQNRADTITSERLNIKILKRMRKLGCTMMLLGAESGSNEMLVRMNKQLLLNQTEKAVANLSKAGISAWLSFMIGMPEETKEDYMATLQFIHKLKMEYPLVVISGPSLYRPIPGSLMYNKAIASYAVNKRSNFSEMSDFAPPNLPGSIQAKICDYPWIQDKKAVYDILLCVERFYHYPPVLIGWIGLVRSVILLMIPICLVLKIGFLKRRISEEVLKNKFDHVRYYLDFYLYFIYYFFPWGRSYLINRQINPEAFSPFLWFKWKWLLR